MSEQPGHLLSVAPETSARRTRGNIRRHESASEAFDAELLAATITAQLCKTTSAFGRSGPVGHAYSPAE